MILDYTIITGDSSISGSQRYTLNTNIYTMNGFRNGVIDISDNSRTGFNDFLISLNSQTLASRSGVEYNTQFGSVYSTDGDVFLKNNNINLLYTSPELEVATTYQRDTLCDVRINQPIAMGTGASTGSMLSSFNSDIKTKMPSYTGDITVLDFFLNGQKVYTGDSISIISLTGLVLKDNITGKIFCFPKKETAYSITGNKYDVYGSKFIEGQTNLHIAGMEQINSLWLEMQTGVKTIKTGLQAYIDQDKILTGILL